MLLDAAALEQCYHGKKPMTYYHKITPATCMNLDHVRAFMHDHNSAIAKAAYQLVGPAASARVFLLCEAVGYTLRLTRAQRSQLVDLHRLLTLEHVGDPDRIESGLFAKVGRSSDFVEECCILSDKLGVLLALIDEGGPANGVRDQSVGAIRQVA
jgi:hypothetical protein